MTSWVRERFSITRSVWVAPTVSADFLSAMIPPLILAYRPFGSHTHAARGDDEFTCLVAVFGDALGEDQLTGTFAFLLPGRTRPTLDSEHVTRTNAAMVLEMLFSMEATG